jgi:hypothetical protein
MALPDLMDLIRHDPRSSIVVRAVAGEPGGKAPDVETLWRKPVFAVETGGTALSGRYSLEDVIDRNRAILMVDDGAGGQPVDVIFPSLIIVTNEPMPGAGAFAKFLRDRIVQAFSDVMEDGARIEISTAVNHGAEHPVTVYLGYGVHAPSSTNPVAQGKVAIEAADGEPMGEPELPGGAAAGIYPRQRMLAFARSEKLAAAIHPDLPSGVVLALGHMPGATGRGSATGLPTLSAIPVAADPDAASVEARMVPTLPGSSADIRFDITGVRAQRGRVKLCSIDVTLDERPSRLHAAPVQGPIHLRLAGFAIRENYAGKRVTRFWIDRTSGGHLRHSSMLAEHDSIVVQGRSARIYRRDELRYERRGSDGITVERVTFNGDRRSVVTLADAAFGYIAPPKGVLTAACGPTAGGDGMYALNWCGEAVTLQFAPSVTDRLDVVFEQQTIGLVGSNPQGFETHAGEDLWVIADGKAVAAGRATHPPGTRLVIGPLVVDVAGGQS